MAEVEEVDQEYRRYVAEIDLYEKEFKPWCTRGKKVVKLYKDSDNERGLKKRFNVLWSNVQTLLPALYARDPQPWVERRFKDVDPVGRVASEVIERCLSYTIDCQNYSGVARQAVLDRLLPGRGVAWHRYEADTGEDEIYGERVIPDYVYWEDFGHSIARTWEEVPMVWRKVYLTRAKLVEKFGDVGKVIPLDHSPKNIKDEKTSEDIKKACIYWIVDKDKRQDVFLSKSHPKIIKAVPDELNLTGGFPCQRPLYATLTTDSLIPTPDYALYQTQAQELEELTARINALQKGLRLAGVYDTSAPALANLLNEGYENKLIGVDQWAKFAEKGGLEGAMDFLPIKEVAETLIALYESREKSKQDLYEITGIADIIRGNSEPSETATAQQIKGRFAVLRISDSQQDVQRWVRDGMRIMGEIIAEHFDLETIKAISGVKLLTQAEKQQLQAMLQQEQMMQQQAQQMGQQPPPSQIPKEQLELLSQPTWEEVHALLKDQVLREFRIDIETDSTIRTDEEADRAERAEFLNAAGSYVERAVMAGQQAPELQPLLAELLMFGVRAHRAARSLEPAFQDAMKKLQQPKEPQPDPEIEKVKIKAQSDKELAQLKAQTDVQVEQGRQAMQHQEELARQQMEDARAEREMQRTAELERYKADIQKEVKMFEAQLKAQADIRVAEIQSAQAEKDREFEGAKAMAEREDNERKSQRDAATKIELERMKAEQSDKDREFQERQAKESERVSGERTAKRDNTLAAAQKLVEALAQLKGAKVH